ncbi:MAG: SH3 domain-containing protein [Chloroflexi bacterium]|nr:SH3 domain-containing protein [Chloroflexota bacterium]
MKRVFTVTLMLFVMLIAPLAALPGRATAQDDPACRAKLQTALSDFMAHCFGAQPGTMCGASGAIEIEMASGQVVSGAGSTARLSGAAAIRLLAGDGSAWGLASLSVPDALDSQKAASMLLFGPLTLQFDAATDLPAGAGFTLSAETSNSACSNLPQPGVLVQGPAKTLTLLRVNGIDLAINGMALLHPLPGGGLSVSALTRETILAQSGTVLFAGYGVQIVGETVSPVAPFDPAGTAALPVEILPDIQMIPLPGNAMVNQEMNLFQRPASEAYTNTMVKAGLPVSVFGRSADDQWIYIRTYDGQMGWFPVSVAQVNVPVEMPIFNDVPPSPVRPFGAVQAYIVTNAEHNNLRDGPGESFAIVATVPLWTQVALYGRSLDDEWLLVETPDSVRAWISVLLISPSTPYVLNELPYPPELGG